MNWDQLVRGFRRALGYVKSRFDKADDDGDEGESTLLGKGWPGRDGRPAFPQAPEPAFARIPK
jgi:hypothetical protein